MLAEKSLHLLDKKVLVRSDNTSVIEGIDFDFKKFIIEAANCTKYGITITHVSKQPDLLLFKKTKIKKVTYQKKVFFDKKSTRYVNYYDDLLLEINFLSNDIIITSANASLTREVIYLTILSRTGKALDIAGIHRFHAMCVYTKDHNYIFTGPSGVGKSTLCLNLLKSKKDLNFASDEITLFHGPKAIAFPLRLGFKDAKKIKNYPAKLISKINRAEHGPKFLLRADFFTNGHDHRISEKNIIFLSRKASTSYLEKSKHHQAIKDLIYYFVIGIGTPQVLELFWEKGICDFFVKVKIAKLRIFTAIRIYRKSKFYTIYGSNEEETLKAVLKLIQQ